jgi:AcrR family transcriptional regulator
VATQTRELILGKAQELIAEGGKPTVAQIAEAAGVSRTSFYRAFESRDALLQALAVQPEPGARERILEAALDMVGAGGLNALSMDELSARAEVSRATLYRLFPGKAALFTGLIKTYSPLEPVSSLVGAMQDQPPEVVIPEIARTVYRTVAGGGESRLGVLRAVFLEMTSLPPDAEEAAQTAMFTMLGSVGAYVMAQMEAGRLRRVHPIVALQAFIGPVFFHLLTQPLLERVVGFRVDGEQHVTQLAEIWLQAMAIDAKEVDDGE